jgi:hypothetical protein
VDRVGSTEDLGGAVSVVPPVRSTGAKVLEFKLDPRFEMRVLNVASYQYAQGCKCSQIRVVRLCADDDNEDDNNEDDNNEDDNNEDDNNEDGNNEDDDDEGNGNEDEDGEVEEEDSENDSYIDEDDEEEVITMPGYPKVIYTDEDLMRAIRRAYEWEIRGLLRRCFSLKSLRSVRLRSV